MPATTRPARPARPARRLPALLTAALLATAPAAGLALAAPASAAPRACPAPGLAQQVADADVVLAGTVTEVARARTDRPRQAEATYTLEVDRVWRGPSREVVEVTAPAVSRTCGLALTPGRRYVLLASAQGADLATDARLGTAPAGDALVARVTAELGEGRAVGVEPTEPAEPVATTVDDSPPPDFGRTAAPGAALALVGLLGLLVVRRRAR